MVDTRLVRIQASGLLVWVFSGGMGVRWGVLFRFGSFLYFLFRKKRVNCVIFPPLPPAALLLICVMHLEAYGLLIYFYFGDLDAVWRRGRFRKIQKEVRRIFFCCCAFQTGAFFLSFPFVWLRWVSYFIWEYSPWAVCQPSNLESFFNANFPSWAAIASWSVKGSDVATEHHSFATVLLSCDSSTKKA